MATQNSLSLRWRIALLSSLAIALLSIVASITAFLVVRSSLISDLQRSLRDDVVRVAHLYNVDGANVGRANADGANDEIVTPLEGPTGGVHIQLYDTQGRLIIASSDTFGVAILDATVVTAARPEVRNWAGHLAGRPVQAAIAPIDFGFVAVIAPTTFIGTALRQLSRSLAVTAFILVASSAVIGYLVAAAAMRPISQLAAGAARLDPNYLQPIPYDGPNDEVGQLSHVLNELILRLRASMDAQRAFLAETSHELRTPLTSLQGFLERAVRRANPEIQRELVDARRIAQTMSRLVADLLQLSRGELVREVVPHLIDPKSEILKPVAEEFQVNLDAEGGTLLLGDPERLRQLVRNLTANAVRATGDPKQVTLRLEHTGDNVLLSVVDTGPGIPPEALAHIFDKFYKGAGGGAGLGLAIAKQIAEVHGGEISVQSQPGNGTTFQVKLPAFAEDSE